MDSHSEKVYTLMCASEEGLQYVANQNIPVAVHWYALSRDRTIDLPHDLVCRMTSLECLRHTILTYDKLMHSCDVKTVGLFQKISTPPYG